MPTALATPASTPDHRPREVRAKATPPAARSGPAFSRTLSERRSDLGVEAAADPGAKPDNASVALARAGTPDQSRPAGSDQPHDAASQANAAAQGGRDVAQVLPTIAPAGPSGPAPATSETIQPWVNVGPGPESGQVLGVPAEQPSAQQPGQQPQQTPQQAYLNLVASQSPAEAATATVGPGSVTSQAVLTQGEVDQLQPEPTPGPVRSAGETQQQSTGTGADTSSGGREGQPGQHHPAIGRAVQVQAAIAVQNVAGHPVLGGPPAALAASGPSEPPLMQTITGLNAEDAPTTGRVIRGLTAMLQQRGGSMTMRLDPPALGQLRVQMTIARGAVTAEFQPGTAEAQALLDRSIATLRSALESKGLTVERLTVHAAPSSTPTRETADDQSQQQNQSSRNQSDAGDGRSRGRSDDPSQQDTPNHRFTANFADAFATQAAATDTDDLPDRTGAQAA